MTHETDGPCDCDLCKMAEMVRRLQARVEAMVDVVEALTEREGLRKRSADESRQGNADAAMDLEDLAKESDAKAVAALSRPGKEQGGENHAD